MLCVAPRDSRPIARFTVRDLDVVLDTKTIRKVVDGDSMLPAVRFTESKIGPEIDMARIVLTDGRERHALSDHFTSHTGSGRLVRQDQESSCAGSAGCPPTSATAPTSEVT